MESLVKRYPQPPLCCKVPGISPQFLISNSFGPPHYITRSSNIFNSTSLPTNIPLIRHVTADQHFTYDVTSYQYFTSRLNSYRVVPRHWASDHHSPNSTWGQFVSVSGFSANCSAGGYSSELASRVLISVSQSRDRCCRVTWRHDSQMSGPSRRGRSRRRHYVCSLLQTMRSSDCSGVRSWSGVWGLSWLRNSREI